MARRRFNKNFIWIAAGVGLGTPALLLAFWKLKPKDPQKLIAAGDMYVRDGDLTDAVNAYNAAVALRPTDAELHLKLAKIYYMQKDRDFQTNVRAAVAEWRRAEELKPDLVEAWQGLLEANMLDAVAMAQNSKGLEDQQYRLPQTFATAREAAQHLLKLDPNDPKARSSIPILTINLRMLRLPIPLSSQERDLPVDQQPTEAQRMDQAVSDLSACMRDHPEDPDLPYWIARAKIFMAVQMQNQVSADAVNATRSDRPGTDVGAVTGDRSSEVRALFGEATIVFDDAINRRPKVAELYYKKYQIVSLLMQVDPSPVAISEYQRQQKDALDHAQSVVSPATPTLYSTYKVEWADYVSRTDPGRAEGIFKDLLVHPLGPDAPAGAAQTEADKLDNDLRVRIHYAQMLERDQTRRADALKVLDPIPTVVPQNLPLVAQPQAAMRLALVRLLRAQLLTDLLEAASNPSVRLQLATRAHAEIDGAAANNSVANEYGMLKARGRLQLVEGSYRDAIQTLSSARDRLAASGGGSDYQLVAWLATALAQGQQTGEAIKLLEETVRSPAGLNNSQPHMMLAQLYLQEQDYEHGRQQVQWLSERYPDDLRTIHLQLEALGRNPDPVAVAPLYARLPERSTAELLEKAGWAQRTNNVAEAERLYRAVLVNVPGDASVSIRLAQVLKYDNKLGEANDVLDVASAKHPEQAGSLKVVRDELNGASQQDVAPEIEGEIAKIKDPMTKAMAWYHLCQSRNDLKGQITHLEEAVAIQPDNREVLNSLFLSYLSAKQFDKASAMLPHLADKDVDDAHGAMFRFKLAMAQGDTGLALTLGRQLTHDYPQFAGSWEYLGEAQEAAGQLEAACQQYTAALDHQGNNPQAMQRLVDCTIRLGHLDDARRFIAEARRKFPDDPTYREQQIRVELAYGDPETVLGIVDQAVKDHPDAINAYQISVQAYSAATQRRASKGDVTAAAGFNDKVHSLLVTALKRFPANVLVATELADVQSQDRSDAGVAAAAETLKALAGQTEWQGQALPAVLLGRMYLQANRPEAAQAPLRHAIELAPQSADARTLLADALIACHKPQDALDALAPAKDQPAVRSKYIDLLLTLNRAPEAEAGLLADLKAKPDDPLPSNLLAHVYSAQGKWDAALQLANQTLAANPKDLSIYFIRGAVYADRPQPDYDAAARDLSVFRQAFPNNLQGRMALAHVLEAKHDLDGATKELEMAVGLAPDDKAARLRLVHAYLAATPARTLDAQRMIAQAQAQPQLAHDIDLQRVAAIVWLRSGDNDRAVTAIRDAMAHAGDQRALLDEYFNILLATNHYDLLLEESAKFIGDPGTSWTVYDYRARARAGSQDNAGAYADFVQALDRAGTAPTAGPALTVAGHITDSLGVDRAVEAIKGRSDNSALWKLVLANCYQRGNDHDNALAAAEGAMVSASAFTSEDRLTLIRMTATLYMTANPPRGDRALPLLERVLQEHPDDVDALNNLACTLTELVNPPRPADGLKASTHAWDLVHKAGRIDPYVYDTHGWMLILNGKVDDGIDVLHQVVDSADFPDAHYHLAEGYMRKGLPEDAKRELNAATELMVRQSVGPLKRQMDEAMKSKITAAQHQVDDMIQAAQAKPATTQP